MTTEGARPCAGHTGHISIVPGDVIRSGLVVVFAALLGACIGSFLNVVLWRLPRGQSITHPPSHCPACGHELRPLELVPLVSWLALRGRCRHCGVRISARYPIVEMAVALLFGLVAWLVVL